MMESQSKVKRLFFWVYFLKFFGFFARILNHFNNVRRIMIVKSDNGVRIIVTFLKNCNSSIFITKNFHCSAFCQSCHVSTPEVR